MAWTRASSTSRSGPVTKNWRSASPASGPVWAKTRRSAPGKSLSASLPSRLKTSVRVKMSGRSPLGLRTIWSWTREGSPTWAPPVALAPTVVTTRSTAGWARK